MCVVGAAAAAPPPAGVYRGSAKSSSVELEVTKGKLTRFQVGSVPCKDARGREVTFSMSVSATVLARIDAAGHFETTLHPGKGVAVAVIGTFSGGDPATRVQGTLRLSGACTSPALSWSAKPKFPR